LYLRTLKIHGFKSFADRTRLEVEPGVTVIVGPNGSGKSNIVDAVSWVLGTQAPKHLRTTKMEEVIFAGTTTRPAHSKAEVELTFDNTERRLPLDLSEVTIGRTLYSDGSSEYRINDTPCRLLDIQEILSDGGVGRHQHVIVNQGQVASILNASPEDHGAVIEEAAGVLKHRIRRQRAAARLERTDGDVKRLDDILKELRKQMRPLKRQANAAARHEDVKSRARQLRLFLGGVELRELGNRLKTGQGEADGAEAVGNQSKSALEKIEARLAKLEVAAGETGRALQRDTAAAARLETTGERLKRISQVAFERRRSLESGAEQADERLADLELEKEDLARDLETALAEERAANAAAERAEITLQALEDEERSLADQEALPVEGVIAALRGDLRALEAAGLRDGKEATAAAHRLEVVTGTRQRDELAVEQLKEEIRVLDKEAGGAQQGYVQARVERLASEADWEKLEFALSEQTRAVAAARARAEALEQTIVVDAEAVRAADTGGAVKGSLIDFLEVPEDMVAAVAAALGPWRGSLLVKGGGMSRTVTDLKTGRFGRLSLLADDGDGGVVELPAGLPGRPLVDLVKSDGDLAERLLGDVVVADSWSAGWSLIQRHPQLRAVTREGDLITALGIQLGAGAAGLETTLANARAGLEEAGNELAKATSREATARRALEALRSEERDRLEALEAVEAQLAGAAASLSRSERIVSETTAEFARLTDRRQALKSAELHRQERLVELRRRLADLEGDEAEQQAAWEATTRRKQEISSRRDQARRLREQAVANSGAAVERRKLLVHRSAIVVEELHRSVSFQLDPGGIARLQSIESTAREALRHVSTHVGVLRKRQAELRESSGNAVRGLDESRRQATALTTTIGEARETLSTLAVELEGLRVRREAVAEGLRRDLDANEEQALAAEDPGLEPGIDKFEHLESLEADLRRMGPVNPLAAQEYAGLSERAEFLEGQISDLHQSAAELNKVIKALDDEMATLFEDAFRDINAFYAENFTMLFPGGRGQLRLSDPKDPLNTGVEIDAQPLGKKVHRLSLLSGGERSLAALAFLFAVFRARPSPFYVLDEVEAALDDANLRRFLRLVELLRSSAQVIIVTHQQHTMESGDTLYGITMEPGGSSQVVAKRMTDLSV